MAPVSCLARAGALRADHPRRAAAIVSRTADGSISHHEERHQPPDDRLGVGTELDRQEARRARRRGYGHPAGRPASWRVVPVGHCCCSFMWQKYHVSGLSATAAQFLTPNSRKKGLACLSPKFFERDGASPPHHIKGAIILTDTGAHWCRRARNGQVAARRSWNGEQDVLSP